MIQYTSIDRFLIVNFLSIYQTVDVKAIQKLSSLRATRQKYPKD